jgi:hypothetical protein
MKIMAKIEPYDDAATASRQLLYVYLDDMRILSGWCYRHMSEAFLAELARLNDVDEAAKRGDWTIFGTKENLCRKEASA